MSVSIAEMRKQLKTVYPGANWPVKVDKMNDNQIFVLYTKFSLEGKFK